MFAQWTPQYTVTFNTNGGSPVAAVTADAGTPIAKPATDPAKTGHTFSGWFTAASGGTSYTWPHTLTADVTMHAHWTADHTGAEEKLFTITGSGSGPITRGGTRVFAVNPQYDVTWTVEGAAPGGGTAITGRTATSGSLKVGANETNRTLTVKAVSVENPQAFNTVTVTVDGIPAVWTELTAGLKGLITNLSSGWTWFTVSVNNDLGASYGISVLTYGKGAGNGRWVVGGGSDYHPSEVRSIGYGYPVMAYSDDDGDTWTELHTTPGLIYDEMPQCLIYDGPPDDRKFILSTRKGNVFWSYDGKNWTKVQSVLPNFAHADSTQYLWQVLYGDIDRADGGRGIYLVRGENGRYTWSQDGKDWEKQYADKDWRYMYTSPKTAIPGFNDASIRYGAGIVSGKRVKMFFGTGVHSMRDANSVLVTEPVNVYSLDGINWTALAEDKVAAVAFEPVPPAGANKQLSWLGEADTSALDYAPDMTVYEDGGRSGIIEEGPGVSSHAEFVAYGNGKFLAVGLGRRLARTDAVTAKK
jgi:uncharacterized repeat protein (TIGR02543 family)